jgi:hypothetical protein
VVQTISFFVLHSSFFVLQVVRVNVCISIYLQCSALCVFVRFCPQVKTYGYENYVPSGQISTAFLLYRPTALLPTERFIPDGMKKT